jgi:AraC-like DNA-binding protein
MLSLRYFPPATELIGRVASFYIMESAPTAALDIHDFAIPVWPNMRFLLRGEIDVFLEDTQKYLAPPAQCAMFGSTTVATHVHMRGSLKVIGGSFFPRGWRELFGVPASDWANKAGFLKDIWGYEPTGTLRELSLATKDEDVISILNQLFLDRLAASKKHRTAESTVLVEQLLVDPAITSVDQLAEKTGLSLRQIERIAMNGYGHPPKQVIRKFRFLRTMATLAKTPNAAWRDMIDELYYDQSHFIRDFKQFTGLTPTEYQKKPPLIMQGFIHSLGSSIHLQTLPAMFEFGADQKADAAITP